MNLFLFFSLIFQRSKCGSFGRVERILNGHKDRVNCVKWIPWPEFGTLMVFLCVLYFQMYCYCLPVDRSIASCFLITWCKIFLYLSEFINNLAVCLLSGAENELVSGSSDKLIIVWKKTASQDCTVSYMFIINICAKLSGQDKTQV